MAADSIHEFKMTDIEGKDVELSDYKGKVTFPMMSKVNVNDDKDDEKIKEDPLYTFLKAHAENKDDVKWNFEKFIVSKDGAVVGRFGTKTKPDADEVVSVIESELKK